MVGLTLFQVAASGMVPIFWPLPTAILTGSATAAGVALINSVRNLGGFMGSGSGGGRDCTPLGRN